MVDNSGRDARQVLVDGAIFTESPRWRDRALWFSDIGGDEVCRVGADGRKEAVHATIRQPSGLGWTRSGDLLVASIHDSTVYRIGNDGAPRAFCGPDRHGTIGTNDMATAAGRSYVTCAGREYQSGDDLEALSQPTGVILFLDHETGDCRPVADGLRMPNGVAITPDGRSLIVAELFAMRVLRFDIRPNGDISKPAVFAQLDFSMDGLCLDADGGVWLGAGGAHRFQRLDRHGALSDAVEVPGWSCIAPMLGGADGRTLFMCVSQMETSDAIFDGTAKSRILTTQVATPAAAEATSF